MLSGRGYGPAVQLMTSLRYALVALACAAPAFAQEPADALTRDYFKAAMAEIAAAPIAPGATILLGDSIMANVKAANVSPEAVNLGLPGDTTPGTLHRLRSLKGLSGARAVVLEGGVNDLGFGSRFDRAIIDNYRTMLAEIPATSATVVIGILPVDERKDAALSQFNGRALAINAKLRLLCIARSNCTYVDAFALLSDGTGNLKASFRGKGDGVHLGAAGAARLEGALRSALTANLRRSHEARTPYCLTIRASTSSTSPTADPRCP